jgi:hypothetical protein
MLSNSATRMAEFDAPWWESSFERYVEKQAAAARQRRGEPPPALPIEPEECDGLIASLEGGTADWYDVHRRLIETLGGGRLWGTKAWKELRSRLIKSQCAQCGSSEDPFTLHHLSLSVTLTDFAREIRKRVFDEFRAGLEQSETIQALGERFGPDGDPRLGCQYCGGTNLRERMRNRRAHAAKPRFVCVTQRNGKVCNREFEEPVLVQPLRVLTPASQRYQMIRQAFADYYPSVEQDIYRDAAILAVRQFARYMAGTDTATFCKRCAYQWDRKGLRLCQRCRDGWHTHERQQCSACDSGTQYVVCKICGKVRHRANYDRCYNCAFGHELDGAT